MTDQRGELPPDVSQSLTLPLAGATHFIPSDPCRKLGGVEGDISWAGWIVIQNNVDFDPGVINIHIKLTLMDVVGVGQSSGWTFLSRGSFRFRARQPFPDIEPYRMHLLRTRLSGGSDFDYAPTDPTRPNGRIGQCQIHEGLGVSGLLIFNSDGTLKPGTSEDCSGTFFGISNPLRAKKKPDSAAPPLPDATPGR